MENNLIIFFLQGHQLQMAGNSLYWPTPELEHHVFSPLGVGNSWKPYGCNSMPSSSGHNNACINLQPIQPSQQFQPANAPVSQWHLLPDYSPQILSSSFSHPRPPVQQHPQHPYPAMYAWPNHPNGPEGHGGDEQSGMQSGFSGDYQNSIQMGGSGRFSGSTFAHFLLFHFFVI